MPLQIGFKEKLAVVLFSHKSEAHRCVREYGSSPTDPLYKVRALNDDYTSIYLFIYHMLSCLLMPAAAAAVSDQVPGRSSP
jgi:hypothetical protein